MDVKIAADQLWDSINSSSLPYEHAEYGKDHLRWMILEIKFGAVEGEKAHRWLGWIQGCVCVGGGATLEEMKQINKNSKVTRVTDPINLVGTSTTKEKPTNECTCCGGPGYLKDSGCPLHGGQYE